MTVTARPAERLVVRAEEVARILGFRNRTSFDHKRPTLEAHGFPARLPGLNGWSRPAILSWLAANGNVEAPAQHQAAASRLGRRFAS